MRPEPVPDPLPLKRQAADALRRARKLPVGPDRNNLRQLALGLRWLEKHGFNATVKDRETTIQASAQLRT
jgi:hypothetical protein